MPFEYGNEEMARLSGAEPKKQDSADRRSPFERDRSRIIHSAAFRRLQGKTQVYGLGASDFYRSRLTHSLEVAQIGKGLAQSLEADPDLVEAICLAHDIGHPPYGHAGETALHEALHSGEGFNGNAQNIRIVTWFERKFPPESSIFGLNLTVATLDGLIKYGQVLNRPDKFGNITRKGYYASDAELVNQFKPHMDVRTFECQLMNWADDVAYAMHDLEDAIMIGTIRLDDLSNDSMRESISRQAIDSYGKEYKDRADKRPLTEPEVESYIDVIAQKCMRDCLKRGSDRLAALKSFMSNQINDCVIGVSVVSSGIAHPPRYTRTLEIPDELAKRVESFKAIVMMCAIRTPAVITLQHAGRKVVSELFSVFSDVKSIEKGAAYWLQEYYPFDWQDRAKKAIEAFVLSAGTSKFEVERFARDYVSSMTDSQAETTWKRLFDPAGGSLFVPRI